MSVDVSDRDGRRMTGKWQEESGPWECSASRLRW